MNPDSPTTARPRLRDRFREQAREDVVAAAQRVLQREGVAGARVDAIAAEAGVSVGTVYNLFGDREALLVVTFQRGREQMLERVRASFATSEGHPLADRLLGFVRMLIGHMRENWSILRLIAEADRARPEHCGPVGGMPHAEFVRTLHGTLSAFLAQGVASGELAPIDLHVATCALMGGIRTTIDVDLALGLDAPSDARADAIVHQFLEGAARR
jgi:AcrR family transcriptional regulator